MTFAQVDFEVRCEWGEPGVIQLAPISDVLIIVDVLSFSTCVEVATSRGAVVYPHPWKGEASKELAQPINAEWAGPRGSGHYSLSPSSLLSIPKDTALVLPSLNGSALSLTTGDTPTLTGCLRNCRAIALAAMTYGRRIAVVPSGEQWPDGGLRPAFEDFIAAGAIISFLEGRLSPEAQAAAIAYQGIRQNLTWLIEQCSSGKELIEQGFKQDVILASQFNVSDCVPALLEGAYRNFRG